MFATSHSFCAVWAFSSFCGLGNCRKMLSHLCIIDNWFPAPNSLRCIMEVTVHYAKLGLIRDRVYLYDRVYVDSKGL